MEMTDTMPAGSHVREVPCAISVCQSAICYILLLLERWKYFKSLTETSMPWNPWR